MERIPIIKEYSVAHAGVPGYSVLKTISFFNSKMVNIEFKKQGLRTLNDDGSENDISKMVISILGVVAEMERKMIRERQLEGIAIAKANGKYKGRNKGTKENQIAFLNKEKNKKALDYLNKGYKQIEVAKIIGLHPNTISKINRMKLLLKNNIYFLTITSFSLSYL